MTRELLVPAAGLALMSFVESIAAGRAFTARASPGSTATRSCAPSARPTWPGHWRDVRRHPDGQTFAGLLALRPVAPIYHANAPRLRERTLDLVDAADPLPRVLVMDLGAVPDVDVTATDLLADFDAELRRRGVTLWMVNLNERPLDMLRRSPEAERYEPRLFRELDDAVAAFADPRTSPPPSA